VEAMRRRTRLTLYNLAKSWFRIGFDAIRQLLRTDPLAAVRDWIRITAKPPKKRRVV